MPAQSKAQQRFMGMVHAVQKGDMKAPSKEVEKAADTMTDKAAKDYASTSHKGLPNKKENMITKERLKELVKEVMVEETEYQTFFQNALDKAGKSIPSMSDDEKKAFFDKIDAAWNGKGEKNEELVGGQKELDVDKDGDIEGDDLADLRAGKKVDEDIASELPKASIPSAVSQRLKLAIDKIRDAKLNPTQKLQLVAQVIDSIGVDKSQLGTITNKIRSKMESIQNEAELPAATLPGAIQSKLMMAIDKMKDSNLTFNQKIQVIGKVMDSLGVDKSEFNKISSKLRGTMESTIKEDSPCWKGYQQIGMKDKNGKQVPNCVPEGKMNEGKKRFKQQNGIGSSKYTISYHDGKKKHKDGSDFFDIKIFKNKPELETFKKDLVSKGFVSESINEAAYDQKIKSVMQNSTSSFKNIGNDFKNAGLKYNFSTTPFPHYIVEPGGNKKVAIISRKNESDLKGSGIQYSTYIATIKESVNEGVSPKDMDKIKSAVEAASSFMNVGTQLKAAGLRYIFATEPMAIYIVNPTPNTKVAIINKRYASKPDFVVGDIAVGIMEGIVNEAMISVSNRAIKGDKSKVDTALIDKLVKQIAPVLNNRANTKLTSNDYKDIIQVIAKVISNVGTLQDTGVVFESKYVDESMISVSNRVIKGDKSKDLDKYVTNEASKKNRFLGIFAPSKNVFQRIIKKVNDSEIKDLIKYTKSNGDEVEISGKNAWGITKDSGKANQAVWQYLDGKLYFENPRHSSVYDKYIRKESGDLDESINEEFKHIISVDTPTQVISKPIAAQILALAKKGVRSKEIGLKMGFVGNNKQATDAFQKVKNQIYFKLNKD